MDTNKKAEKRETFYALARIPFGGMVRHDLGKPYITHPEPTWELVEIDAKTHEIVGEEVGAQNPVAISIDGGDSWLKPGTPEYDSALAKYREAEGTPLTPGTVRAD